MNYQGGKSSLAKKISEFLKLKYKPGMNYYEPFVGAGNVLGKMGFVQGELHANDIHPDLIMMYEAIKKGWNPPSVVSKEEWLKLKDEKPSALRGFVGFGSSWGGIFFSGYAGARSANNGGRIIEGGNQKIYTFASSARNSLLKIKPIIERTKFTNENYQDIKIETGSLIYLDPPYANTVGYNKTEFDHAKFWNWVRRISKNNTVVISEVEAPEDFEKVLTLNMNRVSGGFNTKGREEYLFMRKK